MCGIAGIVGAGRPDDRALQAMARAMAHRGPDGQGTWSDAGAGLAFRRLAIIDLDPRSDQPLHLDGLHLVFNGEIYNYRELREELRALGHEFVTEGDGEVLLHAWRQWGEAALDRVNGMFAFAVWDAGSARLTLAADPFGEKPLHFSADGERLCFASDVRALRSLDARIGAPREDALPPFLALSVMPAGDAGLFEGVRRLPGAHLLRWEAGRVEVRRYWTPQRVSVPESFDAAAGELRELLLDSIRLRLRADVPVGTSLSGGVDSSAIVCLSAELAGDHRRHAFTARFPGFARDEWAYADQVARAAGVVEHHAVEPTAGEMLADLGALVRDQEEPFGSLSIYAQWRVMRAAREAGVTVLLDGQGADELFGGYPWTAGWALRSSGAVAVARALARSGERGPLLRAVGTELLPARAARAWRLRQASPYVTSELAESAAASAAPPPAPGGHDALRRELLRQAFDTSLPALLRYADRNSMAHSREVRLPFLDRRIAEFALSLPAAFLYRDGVTKRVLRAAVRGSAPDAVLDRRDKVGYEAPQAAWLQTPDAIALIRERLLDPGARTRGLLDTAAIEADASAGAWRDLNGIWRALNAELWLDQWSGAPDRDAIAASIASA